MTTPGSSPLGGGRLTAVRGIVVEGHGVASGGNDDPRFPGGTITMQTPHLLARGLDITGFHPATINLWIAPLRLVIARPRATVRGVRWHPVQPAEDFSFVDCRIGWVPDGMVVGLVYHPHPETKPEHHQPDTVVEVLAPFIPGLRSGDAFRLEVDADQAWFERRPAG